MKKKKILLSAILFILITLLIIIGVKLIKNKKALDNMEEAIINLLESKNFTYKITSSNENIESFEKLVLGNRVVKKTKNGIWYLNFENNEYYLVNLDEKTYTKLDSEIFNTMSPYSFSNVPSIFGDLLAKVNNNKNDYWKILFTMKVSNDICEGTKCYKISLENEIIYVSKENFFPIKNIFSNIENKYEFSINTVQENDIVFNDMQNFTETK